MYLEHSEIKTAIKTTKIWKENKMNIKMLCYKIDEFHVKNRLMSLAACV